MMPVEFLTIPDRVALVMDRPMRAQSIRAAMLDRDPGKPAPPTVGAIRATLSPVHFGVHGTGQFWSTGCCGPMWLVKRVSTDPSETTCGGCKRSRAWRKAKEAADALCDPGGEP